MLHNSANFFIPRRVIWKRLADTFYWINWTMDIKWIAGTEDCITDKDYEKSMIIHMSLLTLNPLTAGVAYIQVLFFISTLSTTF